MRTERTRTKTSVTVWLMVVVVAVLLTADGLHYTMEKSVGLVVSAVVLHCHCSDRLGGVVQAWG